MASVVNVAIDFANSVGLIVALIIAHCWLSSTSRPHKIRAAAEETNLYLTETHLIIFDDALNLGVINDGDDGNSLWLFVQALMQLLKYLFY